MIFKNSKIDDIYFQYKILCLYHVSSISSFIFVAITLAEVIKTIKI